MSGPGLNQRDAHHAIHQAAFHEAEHLTLLLRHALRTGDQQRALQVTAILIEHWQTRTLRHAEAEETGWYREVLTERPELQANVTALTRDHALLRLLLAEIQGILSAHGIASGVVERFEAMLLLNSIHSREEEHHLLGGESIIEDLGDRDSAYGVLQPDEPSGPAREGASDFQRDAHTAPVPLAVALPALHTQLVELLRQRGLSPADLQADFRTDTAGQVILHVAFGREYTQTMEWPQGAGVSVAASETTEATEATEATRNMLRQIVEACERATQADYHARMRTPT